MNLALKNSHLASRAAFRVRSFCAGVFVAASVLGAGLVAAEPPPQQQQQQQRREDVQPAQRERGDQRDGRADEQRRAMQERADASRRNGRLTPDERRDLRRQINEAGQDIYSTPPRR